MFFTDLFETPDEKESEKWERAGVAAGGTAGGLSAGQAALAAQPRMKTGELVKSVASGALKGTIPALAVTTSGKQAYDYAKQGKYGQAALAAGTGLAGAATLNPVGATVIPLAGSAINACIDDPASCKELGGAVGELLTGKGDQPRLFEPREKLTPAELTQRRLEKRLSNTNENTERLTSTADANLINAIKDVESGNNPAAVSPKGALGTMQVMPPTAKDPGFGVKPASDFSSTELERVGQDYFNAMLNKYGGDKRLALIAYNMGPTATDKWLSKGGDTARLPKETQGYVPKVLNKYQQTNTTPLPVRSVTPRSAPIANTAPVTQIQPSSYKPSTLVPMSSSTMSSDLPGQGYAYKMQPGRTGPGAVKIVPTTLPTSTPRVRPNPQDLDRLIKQKDRPGSIDDIINRAKKKDVSQNEKSNFVSKLASSNDMTDPEIVSFLNKISTDVPIAENVMLQTMMETDNKLADKIYDILEIRYGDLVKLYGHEVVGDAIQEIVLKSNHSDDLNIESLAKSVLNILRSRLEEQLKETDSADSPDQELTPDKQHHNAVIQIQADLDKIKNTLDIKESKIYFNVMATSKEDLKNKFGFQKDSKGWYLNENANAALKLDAIRTFNILQG